MNKLCKFILALGFISTVCTSPAKEIKRFNPPTPVETPDDKPRNPYYLEIYCSIDDTRTLGTVYTHNSIMAEVIVSYVNGGEELMHVYSELSEGIPFLIPNDGNIKVEVIVEDVKYSCFI